MARHRQVNRRQVRPFTPGRMPAAHYTMRSFIIDATQFEIVLDINGGDPLTTSTQGPPEDTPIESWAAFVLESIGTLLTPNAVRINAASKLVVVFDNPPLPGDILHINQAAAPPSVDGIWITGGPLEVQP